MSVHCRGLALLRQVSPGRREGVDPDHPLSGLLELLDPRPFTEMVATPGEPFGQKAIIKPEAGAMVLFPGWLYHFVNPYFGEGERISIAFNVSAVETTRSAQAGGMR